MENGGDDPEDYFDNKNNGHELPESLEHELALLLFKKTFLSSFFSGFIQLLARKTKNRINWTFKIDRHMIGVFDRIVVYGFGNDKRCIAEFADSRFLCRVNFQGGTALGTYCRNKFNFFSISSFDKPNLISLSIISCISFR